MGTGVCTTESEILRHGGPAHPVSGRPRDCALHCRRVGILPAVDENGKDEAALALLSRAMGCVARGLVPCWGGHDALLSLKDGGGGQGRAEAGMDRTGAVRAN